jgi:hypothetical protein
MSAPGHRPSRRRIPLRALAHARAGDKGDTANVAVFAYDPRHYCLLVEQVTPEAVANAFAGIVRGPVRRYEVESLCALNFVMRQALEGGVNASLNLDGHGKSWSSFLLAMTVEVPEDLLPEGLES